MSFIAVADAKFPEVIESLNASNAPEDVAAFLSAQAEDPSPQLAELGLSDTPIDAARDLIQEAAAEASAAAAADSETTHTHGFTPTDLLALVLAVCQTWHLAPDAVSTDKTSSERRRVIVDAVARLLR